MAFPTSPDAEKTFPPPPETFREWEDFERAVWELEPKPEDGTREREPGWIFRGVLKSWKEPLTSLERLGRAWELEAHELPEVEDRLTRDFKRHPEGAEAVRDHADNLVFVWSVMQHYKAPTRLMDWTYSPYVAAFFAFDELLRKRSNWDKKSPFTDKAAVWALNTQWLDERLGSGQPLTPDEYDVVCGKKDAPDAFAELLTQPSAKPFISTFTPMVLNQRLSVQQGVFLCPGDVTRSWRDNLDALGWSEAPSISRNFVLAMDCATAFHRLHRMNVSARSLLPGLDGYGQFLFSRAKHLLELPLQGKRRM